jgi:prophage regulatory protein
MVTTDIAPYAKLSEVRLIRISEVISLTGLSKSYVYALAADGRFPKSISLVPGGTSRAWVLSEISDWILQRIKARG